MGMDKARKLLKKLLKGEAMEEARRPLLKELDKNSDATKILISDLKDILVAMGIEPTSEELGDMMKKLNKNDGDDDGYIEMEELLDYYEKKNVSWKELKKDLKKKSLWLAKKSLWFGKESIVFILDIFGYVYCIYFMRDEKLIKEDLRKIARSLKRRWQRRRLGASPS